jgi:hypothetical protein
MQWRIASAATRDAVRAQSCSYSGERKIAKATSHVSASHSVVTVVLVV